MNRHITRPALLIVFLCLIIIGGVAAVYYRKYHQAIASNSTLQAQLLAERLGATIQLPDEEPVLAEVADKNKLGNQLLADEAENGDQILIFSQSGRAILYRPSTKKVINIYPISP